MSQSRLAKHMYSLTYIRTRSSSRPSTQVDASRKKRADDQQQLLALIRKQQMDFLKVTIDGKGGGGG